MRAKLMLGAVLCCRTANTALAFVPQAGHAAAQHRPARSARRGSSTAVSNTRLAAQHRSSNADKLRDLLAEWERTKQSIIMPCCYDGLTARLVEEVRGKIKVVRLMRFAC
jgi:hypothetical protein